MPDRAIVLTTGLKLRAAPNTQAHVIDELARGDACVVLGQSAAWYHVNVAELTTGSDASRRQRLGQQGWVHGNYVRIKRDRTVAPVLGEPAPLPTPLPQPEHQIVKPERDLLKRLIAWGLGSLIAAYAFAKGALGW
jgi:hypothetical protein